MTTPLEVVTPSRARSTRVFRTAVFWAHLATGVTVGSIVLVMSVTGTILAFQRQIQHWSDVHTYRTPASQASSTPRLPMSAIVTSLNQAQPDAVPSMIVWRNDPTEPVAVTSGTRTLYLNPNDGRVYGEGGGERLRAFFTSVNGWHRWLGMATASRNTGRAITAACNLGFFFLVLSGFYLWWPRSWTLTQFKQLLWFRRGLPAKARYFNWHHTVGFWTAIPLAFIVGSGIVMSYPWANALLYRAFGETVPAAGGGGRGGGSGAQADDQQDVRAANAGSGRGDRGGRSGGGASSPAGILGAASVLNVDALAIAAESYQPGWKILTMRLPSRPGPVAITIDRGDGGQPALRDTLTLDSRTAEVLKWEPFSGQTPGRRARSWLRFTHTGEAFGLAGQTIAAVASFGVAFLFFSGVSLAVRRVFSKRRVAARVRV